MFLKTMNKKRIAFLLVTFSLLFSLPYTQTSIRGFDIELPNKEIKLENGSYYASSPYDFFNESKHPRYPLVTRPFGIIQYPNKAHPIIVEYDEEFEIIVEVPKSSKDFVIKLINGSTTIDLTITDSKYKEDKRYFTVVPTTNIEGLYDLQLNCSEGDDYQTHSVKIMEEKKYPFTFVQISDLHFPTYFETGINTTEINLQEIEKIRALNPDFIICTGDLMQGPQLLFLNPEGGTMSGESQLKLGLWALDLLNLPVFLIAGNHEISQSGLVPDNLEENWYKFMGPLRYQSFDFLDWSFVGFGSSFEGLNLNEKESIDNILNLVANNANILYYHFDFNGDATRFINKFPIEVALYGHYHEDNGTIRETNEQYYFIDDTLYHLEGPLYGRYFTLFTVNNQTSLSAKNETYNFVLRPYTPTKTNAPSYIIFLLSSMVIVIALKVRKRKV